MFTVVQDSVPIMNCPPNSGFTPGVGTQSVTCQANGLTPSTTYSFALFACWGQPGSFGGSNCAHGSFLSFTTLPVAMNTIMTIYTNAMTAFFTSSTSSQHLGAGFDFTMSISPASTLVIPGGTAQYAVGVTYSDPSYAGTMINVQVTGLGPGMDYSLSQTGALAITTSTTTPTGNYPFIIIGSASGVTHQVGGTVIVAQSSISTTPVTTTIMPPTSTSASPASTVTSVVTSTIQPGPASTETSSTSTQSSASDIIGLLQQNSLFIIAVLVIALVAVLLRGGRRTKGQPAQVQPQTTNAIYCSRCGAQASTVDSFCKKCGTKLG